MKLSRKIGVNIIIAMLSIENILFLNYKIAGFDIVDIGVIIGFILCFYSSFIINGKKILCHKYLIYIVAFASVEFCISVIKGYQFRYIFPDLRNFLFMFFTYEIFRDEKTEVDYIISVIPLWGLVNSIVSLASLGVFANNYVREIYTPLWISVFSVGCIMLDKTGKSSVLKYLIAALNVIAIFLSQTRSYIFPVVIIFALCGINAVKRHNIKQLILAIVVVLILYSYIYNNGYYDLLFKRISGSLSEESTMWLRFENSINHIKSMGLLDWLLGRGFGERFNVVQYDGSLRNCSDLEMFLPNQLIESGIVIFIFTYGLFIKNIFTSGVSKKPPALLASFVSILIGGFISGLVGMIGSVVLGVLFGMMSNNTGILKDS